MKNSFGKEEKLCSEKDIDALYKEGHSFLEHPLVVYFTEHPELEHSLVMISVSKKKFKNAVDRNLIKRRIREAYRLNKSVLAPKCHLALVYIANEILEYAAIEKALVNSLRRILPAS